MQKTTIIGQLTKLIFPVECLGCGIEGDWVCLGCQKKLIVSRSEQCALCSKAAINGICQKCREATKIDGIIAVYPYKERVVQQLIKRVKYRGHTDALETAARICRKSILDRLPKEELAITFVPIDKKKMADRGFNQAEELAKKICQNGWPVESLFIKTKITPAQAKLGRKERINNLRQAFKLKTKNLSKNIIIFDDVITTGTTIKELAKLLKRKGVQEVWAVTIAHG